VNTDSKSKKDWTMKKILLVFFGICVLQLNSKEAKPQKIDIAFIKPYTPIHNNNFVPIKNWSGKIVLNIAEHK